ncbi:type IV pilus biogenesis/stability protein PilW [Halomonas sp. HP20-15]|uniref:type IV pilus biogenesis/stability protein PilW n=1 Tax=Halomonas sp. HP20-15 TaxID=3085901 RepID=UPI0029829B05|nr:type IV pilus biogenesis/stability protein PilW [Halomonas sp. HP20-15]MDW5376508.1 type IV pilus biogenesis/stability protein PilW [Halomonas sp. HP20-15]
MIRRPRSLTAPRLGAVLLATLWLSGCATTQQDGLESDADPERAAKLNVAMGIEYMEQGNLSRARSKLEHALAIDPGNADALQANALLYQRQGENQLAREFFERALAAEPDLTRARNNYAAFLYRQGEIAAACEQLKRASQDIHYDNRAQLFTNLGRCQLERGALADAAESLERAQNIDPRHAPSYLALARTLTAQGEYDRAWDQLQRFIRLAGTPPESLRLAEQIASARGDGASAAFYSRQLKESQRAP